MINVSIARRYARALLAVATEVNRVDEVMRELDGLVGLMAESPDLRNVMASPGFSREQRQEIFGEVTGGGAVAEPTASFLRLLIDRGRIEHLQQIARIYTEFADEAARRVRAEVFTPRPLELDEVRRLEAALSDIEGNKSIEMTQQIVPSLLGGVVAKVGDRVFDGSLKTQLEKIRQAALS